MDDSEPFLPAKIESSDDGYRSLNWLLPRRRATDRILKSSIVSHLAVFIATTLLWGGILLLTAHFSPAVLQRHRLETSPSNTVVESSPPAPAAHTNHVGKLLSNEIDYLTCGKTREEARTRGCIYDTLSNAWIPGQCRDDFSIMEYELDGSWYPFADRNRTQPLQKEELGDLDFYYTSLRDHIVHCAALWRRQFRAWSEGWRYLDDVLVDPVHTMHCSKYLVDWTDKIPNEYRTTAIKVQVGHVGCHVLA
ncbi:uncharacterized protein Z520_02530 [Fonsecaea multimorphosa CBS 102226]|uniref:Uncharacterized protein n=1 Tax=Fonsecaea multimorphosa CBS 102226 TaxID=1442371 RepID=A0A0D2IZC3_9EURO|nr:uncharacterized protein Z520_02530 [Fonsecaea multimorphosa CBS 102226]KIY02392.1 hypothetical protein Z520_02530 [Fonsecaea multimorphosa CBS 102226]OAL29034.1 hypothetical protein AYO22_02470 [Fonsecaea multimorphosa]